MKIIGSASVAKIICVSLQTPRFDPCFSTEMSVSTRLLVAIVIGSLKDGGFAE